ncbi:MAG: undecaprenyl-diphosphate phosphatase [Candidatus Poribacteria bacterium]
MTTFQAVINAILYGSSEILPVGASAHLLLPHYVVGWAPPPNILLGAFNAGAAISLLIYFRDDWASMVSSLIRIILFRKQPMAMDEQLPLYSMVAIIPASLASYLLPQMILFHLSKPYIVAATLAFTGLLLGISDTRSKHQKGMPHWNLLDSCLVGIGQLLLIVPGSGIQTGGLIIALARNYKREAAIKFVFFVITPFLITNAILNLKILDFSKAMPDNDLSWLSLAAGFVVSLATSLIVLSSFIKSLQQNGFMRLGLYRVLIAIVLAAAFWLNSASIS